MNKQRLNLDKTEALLVSPDSVLGSGHDVLMLEKVAFPWKDQVQSLGVLLDPILLLDKQVGSVVRSVFY